MRLPRLALALSLALSVACGPKTHDRQASPPVAEVRRDAESSNDPELVSRWLLAELISPGGKADQAARARTKLGARGESMFAHLARGLDDAVHGRLKSVADHYFHALRAARDTNDADAPLIAWFAVQQAMLFRHVDPKFFERWKPFVRDALTEPRHIGWRARAELAELWQNEAWSQAEKDVLEAGVKLHGCATNVRFAGPFGHDAAWDTTRSFPAEAPGPWPQLFPSDPGIGIPPEVLPTEREGCFVSPKEVPAAGIFYAETFVELPERAEVLLAIQGAYGIWVNDHRVLERDLREWGSWTRFGVAVELPAGRHRVLARLGDPGTSVRLLHLDGRPLAAKTSADPRATYSLVAPKVLPEANVLDRFVAEGTFRDPGDDLTRYLGAGLAHGETQADVANVLLEPLLAKPERATGPVLGAAALYTDADPVFSDSQRRDLMRELSERAVARDRKLWYPRLSLALLESERAGLPEAARALKKLAAEFVQVPAILSELSRIYSELGWRAEFAEAALALAASFPEDVGALEPAIGVLDAQGRAAEADALVERIRKLDPDHEIQLARALDRQDYAEALRELKRIAERRPQRKDITERIYDVMVRAGNESETWKKLEAAIQSNPRDEDARLALADASLASGKRDALARALIDAVEAGAPSAKLEEAFDLVEGVSELEPYRHDARRVVAEFEKSGKAMTGTAARILDYAAIWIHADGSSRMLEHQIIRVQSAEAITAMAEQPLGNGLVLHMRVLKKDGRALEPELVEGKPTVTMPHLEVGDYIETERIESHPGDGQRGKRYVGPRWYFREENIAYARSEFVVIAPKSKPLSIETRNGVPKPEVQEDGAIIVRRWRVDHSPAAPVEPFGAPIVEFMPSVQIGWGISLQGTLDAMSDAAVDLTPIDPRISRVARRIVEGVPEQHVAERAQKLYRWVVGNVEEGEENDGRRVILGRNGNLWRGYMMLCRALGIEVEYAVAESRLALPPAGPFSAASTLSLPLLRVETEKNDVWLTLGSKYAPFGYVPAEARGMAAYALSDGKPRAIRVPDSGLEDRVVFEGDVALARDGSAEVELVQTMYGKYATALRGAFSEMPAAQVRDVIESRLVGNALRGARLQRHRIEQLDHPDRPLVIRTTSRVPSFAQVAGSVLLVSPPFSPRIGQLAALPARQTPLLVVDSTEQHVLVRLHLPPGMRLAGELSKRDIADGRRRIELLDRVERDQIVLERRIILPAGRVQVADYPKFLRFARTADDALSASIRVKISG